jgi:hypothetical protein
VNRSKFTEQEAENGRCSEFKPYAMGMQVSCSVDTEVSEKDRIWQFAEVSWSIVKGPGSAKGM